MLLFLIFPLGFLIHISPRFPGSLAGSLIGIAGALLMLAALAYPLVKRLSWLRDRITPRLSLATLLAIHVYAGVLGPLLGLVHSAHKFTSPLGISLIASMMVVVLSGYVGRFYLGRVARAVRARSGELAALQSALVNQPTDGRGRVPNLFMRTFFDASEGTGAEDVALALADVEYEVRAERAVQAMLQRWLNLHIFVGVLLYLLLALHIWSGLYFGLRWL